MLMANRDLVPKYISNIASFVPPGMCLFNANCFSFGICMERAARESSSLFHISVRGSQYGGSAEYLSNFKLH